MNAYVPGRLKYLWLAMAVGITVSLAFSAAEPYAQQPPPPPPQQQPPQPPPQPPAQAEHPLDKSIGWLMEAQRNFNQGVRNYTCTLIKKEKVRGVLGETNIILFSARVQPFSVYMRWTAPKAFVGQEVAYVQGRNRGNMRVKAAKGAGKLLGFIDIEPTDPRVMQHSRHTILEAGLGNMIEQNLNNMKFARQMNKTNIRTADFLFDKRPCVRIETENTVVNPQYYCYRSVLYLEKESKIPMRQENYDWPSPGNPGGDLLEEFSYANLQFNVDMRDDQFNK